MYLDRQGGDQVGKVFEGISQTLDLWGRVSTLIERDLFTRTDLIKTINPIRAVKPVRLSKSVRVVNSIVIVGSLAEQWICGEPQ